MAAVPTQLARAALTTTTSTVLYTTPATGAVVTNIVLTNITATTQTATVTFGGIALFQALPVPANGVVTFDIRQVLNTTQTIVGYAGAATAVNVHIAGVVL